MSQEMRFYHLETSPLERALPQLVKAAYGKGHRLVIKTSESEIEKLNDLLWSFSEEDFIPHGSDKDGHPESQCVWITSKDENPNGADTLILTHGQESEDISSFDMCCDMFNGNDETHLKAARTRWKKFKDADELKLSYYQQSDNGAWEKKA